MLLLMLLLSHNTVDVMLLLLLLRRLRQRGPRRLRARPVTLPPHQTRQRRNHRLRKRRLRHGTRRRRHAPPVRPRDNVDQKVVLVGLAHGGVHVEALEGPPLVVLRVPPGAHREFADEELARLTEEQGGLRGDHEALPADIGLDALLRLHDFFDARQGEGLVLPVRPNWIDRDDVALGILPHFVDAGVRRRIGVTDRHLPQNFNCLVHVSR
mmetsp:Transcript_47707/g.93187  ORF Transcript_47707/g.93187 Transcript_47707/m.93187 type:complete len:211 (-) Transcript_47707:40-672(-)